MRLSIIIPYYQTKTGILPRAVLSVLRQVRVYEREDIEFCELIVVDDESPITAESELGEIQFPGHLTCRVHRQDNRGPAGARNQGLDMAGDDCIVAFLDSDDEWMADHLDRAVTAIAAGCDVYGCNWIPLSDHVDAMSMPARQSLELAESNILEKAGEIAGDPLISEMTAPMCKLSGLVYNGARFKGLRFDARFRNASEDVLFIYTMMLSRPRVLISTQAEVRSGRGVNIYESAERGTAERLSVIYDQTRGTKLAYKIVGSRLEAKDILRQNLLSHRRSFVANVWHMLRKLRIPVRPIIRQVALDPAVLFSLVYYPLNRVWGGRR